MFSVVRGAIRTTRNVALVGGLIILDQTMINIQVLAAIPGDVWHRTCRHNAKRCLHAVDTEADTDAICCAEVANIMDGLPTAA